MTSPAGLSPLLEQHAADMSALAEDLLRDYITHRSQTSGISLRGKEFNDPVWGTLQVKAAEIVVLDSPLIQRLRRIRQLGVAHLVYPAAVHTRFEHSLGVSHQVRKLVESLEQHPADRQLTAPARPMPAWQLALLRLGGLCHDVGHGVMSHVSENALDNERQCVDLQLEFQDFIRNGKKNQLSEISAYFIIGSKSFLDLLKLADALAPTDLPLITSGSSTESKLAEYQTRMQSLVVGRPVDSEYPLLHELISGPFDGDKLDYMPRDAAMCGVPVITDVPRLVQKVRSLQVGQSELPEAIGRTVEQRASYIITGIARSGARTLDELALGRALLFDKIYRHQKVRAAEAMVASIISELLAVSGVRPALLPFRLTDEELLSLTKSSALEALRLDPSAELGDTDNAHIAVAVDLASRLRDRRLLARGFAFSSKMPLDPYRNDPPQRAGVEQLNRLARDPRRRSEFVKELIALTSEVASLTDEPAPETIVPHHAIEPYVWISAPVVSDGSGEANQIGHAWLIGEHGEPIRRADQDYAETRGWSDAYVATRDLGLIFCPQELAPSLYLAAEALVTERFGIRVPYTMRSFAKQDPERLHDMQSRLAQQGWYRGRSRALVPEPSVLQRADSGLRLDRVMDRLSGYSGPLIVDPATGKTREDALTRQRIRDWLRQFQEDSLVDAALEMLSHIRYIGRKDVNAAVEWFLDSHPEFSMASLSPLGQAKDSSSVLTYFAGDAALQRQVVVRSLEDALIQQRPIILVDDYVGRGSATITILETWLGVADTQGLHQERAPALPPHAIELLKSSKIALLYVAGRAAGQDVIAHRAQELGLKDLTVYVYDLDIPRLTDPTIIADTKQREALIEVCRQLGNSGLVSDGRDREWAEERALGYGNEALLLVSSFNTPTAAVTCLWHDAPNWFALLPRRPKR